MSKFVGLYWTLPVNWAGFVALDKDVNAAADASRTIRYQRARVRAFVASEPGAVLAREIAFMDTSPDRATAAVADVLRRYARDHAVDDSTVLYVRFSEIHGWRRNHHLERAATDLGLHALPLPPDPIEIDGALFDPARHFSAWRALDKTSIAALRTAAAQGLAEALAAIPDGPARWDRIATWLNQRGIRTKRGAEWTPDGARKTADRHHAG